MSGSVPAERIERVILFIRSHKVILDKDLAAMYGVSTRDLNEAPRSSLLRRSSHFGYEGRKLRGILRNSPKPRPSFAKATEGSPRLHPRSKLRGIRRRRIKPCRETSSGFPMIS